jgi:hypothetical protein
MWGKRIAISIVMTAVAAVGAVGAAAPAARAGGVGAPIFGDLNADGFIDTSILGFVAPNFCSVIVNYGGPPDVFIPPVVHIYLRPGSIANCPDLGTAFDFNGTGGDDLWLGWSTPPPANLNYNRLILDPSNDFQIVSTFLSPVTPVFLGRAVFTPGGTRTNYSYGKGGFASYIITPTFTGLGPEKWCSVDVPTIHLRDFNGNRAQDVLISYTKGCSASENGVVAVLDGGTVQQLEIDPSGQQTWAAKVVFANSDKIPDVQTVNQVTGQIDTFIGVGDGSFVLSPTAVDDDAVIITDATRTAIDVLANDYTTNQAKVTITTPPRSGTAQITSSRTVIYTPRASHGTTDRFVYQLTENGRTSRATVNIRFQG